MGFTLTAAPKKRLEKNSTPREKTASGDFFQNPNESRLENRPQPLKTQQGARAYSYKIVSGRPVWPSRDPIMELGGENLYSFVGNSAVEYIDILGREPKKWPLPGRPVSGPGTGRPNPPGNCFGTSCKKPDHATRKDGESDDDMMKRVGNCKPIDCAQKCEKPYWKVALWVTDKGDAFHAAGQLGNGDWMSQTGLGSTLWLVPGDQIDDHVNKYFEKRRKKKPKLTKKCYCCCKDADVPKDSPGTKE